MNSTAGNDRAVCARQLPLAALGIALLVLPIGCAAPIGADRTSPARVERQVQITTISDGRISHDTQSVLYRFDLAEAFDDSPDATLRLLHLKAEANRERSLLFALSELNYVYAESLRRSVTPWEPRDPRDYYFASALYAWFYLFDDLPESLPNAFDRRFRAACDFYNGALGRALTEERRSTNAIAVLKGGTRKLPMGSMEIEFSQPGFSRPVAEFDRFVLADHYLVRGLSVRNGQAGLGAPLGAVSKPNEQIRFARTIPATVLLRPTGSFTNLAGSGLHGSLELYSPFEQSSIKVEDRSIPLETDTTFPLAYTLNSSFVWSLGMSQFLSSEERVPTGVYMSEPYKPGRVPVVLVHGTFSSPVWWAEMINTLMADPELGKRCQFWYFVYNSGNPTVYSAVKLREALSAKIKEMDPDGRDPALRQMVVVGHSQGGLLTKLAVTDTGDKLWQAAFGTNFMNDPKVTEDERELVRQYTSFTALPFVTRAVFISTPHRGSYLANNFVRKIAFKLMSLPKRLVDQSRDLISLSERSAFPAGLKRTPTSLDSMSTNNPLLLALAEIPPASGVKSHSIIAVEGEGDYHEGKDGLVAYSSAHVDYAESEFIVQSFHSCQSKPSVIEEVRRILREHLASLPANVTNRTSGP